MDQKTFHALYEKTPEGFRAQLIAGTVYVTSARVTVRHGGLHARAVYWLGSYASETSGTEGCNTITILLSEESEPEPDACLYVLPTYQGQVAIKKCLVGPPDLIVEVANTTRSIDLGSKKHDYELNGVREYIIVVAREKSVIWYHRRRQRFTELRRDDGLFRSVGFPGLWLDPKGLFSPTTKALTAALRQGLASPEHAAFVAELAARRKNLKAAARRKRQR